MYTENKQLYIAHCDNGPIYMVGKMANRHGLIAGATGTGKTVTLQVLAESFSQAGVPCFMADMKGDLSGISQAGKMSGFIEKRLPEFFPVENAEGDNSQLSTFNSQLLAVVPRASSMCLANKAIRSAPPSPTWDRNFWHDFSASTKPKRASLTSFSRLPTTEVCFLSI